MDIEPSGNSSDELQIHPKMLENWARIYVDKWMLKKVGPAVAREWARNTLKNPFYVKQMAPYVQKEFEKRGINP